MSSNLYSSAPLPLSPLHLPGRSKTRAAWSALVMLLLFFLVIFFHAFFLRASVRSLFLVLQPITGLTIKAETIEVSWKKSIHGHHVIVSTGQAPYITQLMFEDCSLELSSWQRLFLGDHQLITSFQAKNGKGIIDLRTSTSPVSFWKKTASSLVSTLSEKLNLLPASVLLHDISFVILSEGERYTVDRLSCTLPNKMSGQLSYESILIEANSIKTPIVHCQLSAGKAKALWDGRKLSLHQLSLANELLLRDLTIIPHRDRMELGIVVEVFDGLLRADGSMRHTPQGTFLDSALLVQQLPLGRLSHFLGLQKNLAGTIREGRLTFRGFMLHLMDAEVSLRMLADNVRLEKRGWASLAVTAHLIGRKISLTEFQLNQHENRVTASGELTLPEEWHKIAQAPFLLKLKANISDASQLSDLMGTSWKNMTGKLFADGEIHGATNRAEGYFNIQGSTMTAYGLPLNSLKLQLLFQGKKTNLTNFEIWSGSDRLQCSGVIENKWPHHYEGNITAQSSNLSEKLNRIFHYSRNEKAAKADGARQTKNFDQGCMSPYCPDQERDEISGLIPFLQQSCSKVSDSWLTKIPNSFFKNLSNLHGGTFQGTWKGDGEATYHEGSFQFTLHDLVHNSHKVRGESEGCYGPEWISFSHLMWEEDTKKYNGQLTLSSQGINLQNFSLKDNGVLTLSGKAFLPLDARLLLQQPFSLSQALQHNLPLDVHLQCHHFIINHESNIGVLAESLADNEKQRAYKETFDDSNPAAMQLAGLSKKSIFPWHLLPTFFDGTIDASGLYEKPTLHVSLIGREREKLTPVLKFNLSAEQGSGIIDTTWTLEKNKTVTLQGKLPVGLMIQKESAPLKEAERWSLGISSAPLDLKLCISSLSFDDIATHFLPSFFHIEKSFISGNLTCKGTLGQPEPDGELQLQAAGIMMGSKIPSLHHLQGRLFFNKDKMEWRDATAWVGKEKVTMSGTTEWYHQKHDYHFSGTHLLLYQSTLANVTGDLNLSLQGENNQGTLHGNVTVREVEGSPKLFVTPFLIPPGIELASLISTNTPAPWSINVTMTTPAEPAATRVSCPFKNINLHLTGDLFSPSLEGNIVLQELPIIFPNMTMRLIEGSCSFEANKPWQPIYHLTANGTSHHHQKIGVTLLNNHILQFQSDPFTSPTTLALQLSQQDQEAWIFQLPYWIREQSLMEPTTLAEPTSLHNSLETRNDLGFIGCEIFYQAEMK